MRWKYIFNPFERYDEKNLFLFGITSFIVLYLLNIWTSSCFLSYMRINRQEDDNLLKIASSAIIANISIIVTLFILGKIIYKKTRIIDIMNTVLVSQAPVIVLFFLEKYVSIEKSSKTIKNYQSDASGIFPIVDYLLLFLYLILNVAVVIYCIVLLYNGFKTASHVKKWQHILLFSLVSFITIIICQTFNN